MLVLDYLIFAACLFRSLSFILSVLSPSSPPPSPIGFPAGGVFLVNLVSSC